MAKLETIPLKELTDTLPIYVRDGWHATLAVLDSMYLDYHDTRANPTMSIDDHIAYCKLSEPNGKFVRDNLKPISMHGHEFVTAKVPIWLLNQLGIRDFQGVINDSYLVWSMAEITVDARRIVCSVPYLYYIDLAHGENVYKA